MQMPTKTILLAIPEEWNKIYDDGLLVEFLRNEGFDVLGVFSYEDALKIIQTQNLSAVVMTSDWAMKQEDGPSGLMKFLKGKTPTMSLITTTTYRNNDGWMDELFDPRQHEYQHIPADINAIVVWLNHIVKEL